MNGYAHRVLWNMPDVTTITIGNVRIYGTILAPKAYTQAGNNNIQGQIIVKDFTGKLQVDWVKFTSCLPIENRTPEIEPVPEPEPEPEPESEVPEPEPEPEVLEPEPEPEPEVVDPETVLDTEPDSEVDSEPEVEPSTDDTPICTIDHYPFGVISIFSAFSFNDFTSYDSDVQGRIAAKNHVEVSSCNVNKLLYGDEHSRCDEDPLMSDFQYAVLAGSIKIDNSAVFNGGIAYTNHIDDLTDNVKTSVANNGCTIDKVSNIDFDAIEVSMNKLSQDLASLEDTENVSIPIIFFSIL